jgi:uncharacterized protein involved in exopolysaccharide biosynthesis
MNDIQYAARDEKLTIARLLVHLRQWPKLFAGTALLIMVAVITYAWTTTPIYRSVVKMMPRQNDAGGGLQSFLGQLGGIASMIGLSRGSVDEQEALAYLRSRALFNAFAEQQHLMSVLFKDKWDPVAQRWRTGVQPAPTIEDAWRIFDGGIRRVTDDPKTRLITLEVTWKDRQLASVWANGLVRLANEEMRQRTLAESAATIASFEEQLAHTESVELRQAIYKLMEVQLARSAEAKSHPDYALNVVDPAFVSDPKHFVAPRRFLLLVISLPLGLFVAACTVLGVQFLSSLREQMRRSAALT